MKKENQDITMIERMVGSPIQQFYAGQNIFITGGTGFLGKILIQKLLRSCPDIATIYLLVRPKKGMNIHQRIDNLFNDVIFYRLKDEVPKFRHKIVGIAGDCSLPGLGLLPSDKQILLRDVSIVFNAAATVRFDEEIQTAVAINIEGTKETLNLCKFMLKLTVVVHVSTVYSNCIRDEIDETFYDSPMNSNDLIELVHSTDSTVLNSKIKILLKDFPNTYSFTKQIAEQIVLENGKKLPIGVFRPAIIVSTYKEPLEGWIDNINGPTGILTACALGLIRIIEIDIDQTAELVPVDYTVNALIASAWDIASKKNEMADPPIYNYISSWNKTFTWGEYSHLALASAKRNPSIKSFWCYNVTPVSNYFLSYILTILLHIIPGILLDIGLFLTGRQMKILKIYKKVHKLSSITRYFTTRSWQFKNNTTKSLWNNLTVEDKKLFYFSMDNFNWNDFIEKSIIGLRVFMFKDDLSTVPIAKKRMKIFIFSHNCIKYGFIGCITYMTFCIFRNYINLLLY